MAKIVNRQERNEERGYQPQVAGPSAVRTACPVAIGRRPAGQGKSSLRRLMRSREMYPPTNRNRTVARVRADPKIAWVTDKHERSGGVM